MNTDWQTWAALGAVCATVAVFLVRLRKGKGAGCGSGCGCGSKSKIPGAPDLDAPSPTRPREP